MRRVLVAGATGLVGRELLARLVADSTVSGVTAIVRRDPGPPRLPAGRVRTEIVDFDYPLEIARQALEGGARHFLLVSAIGADARSGVFYNRVKGELETAVTAVGFRSLTIVRPSLLLGERAEFRLAEALIKRLAWAAPRRYAPVHAGDVAAALVTAAREDRPGVRVIESADIPRA